MTYHPLILTDSGFLFAYYSRQDSDFDVYRRYRKQPFKRVFWPE